MKQMTEAQQKLAAENVRLAYRLARCEHQRLRCLGVPADKDDLLGEAVVELCKAAVYFAPERGIPFGSYAAFVIRRRWRDRAKQANRRKRQVVACDLVEPSDHRHPAPGATMEKREIVERLRSAIGPKRFSLLWAYAVEGRTQADLANSEGTTPAVIFNRLKTTVLRAKKLTVES